MSQTIEQRTAKITIVGIISFVFSFVQSIVLIPIILTSWGSSKYGQWLALFAGVNLLQTLDLGHQHYIGNEINVLYFKSITDLRKILSSSVIVAWLIGFIEILITFILIYSGKISSLLGFEVTGDEYSYAILSLMMMWFIFGSVSGIITKLLVPVGMFYKVQWITLIISFVQFLGLMSVVLLKGSILSAAITFSIVQSISTIIVLLYLRRILPEFFPWWEKGNLSNGLKNFFRSIMLTFNIIIQQLSINGLILFISNFYQIVQVPVFTTIRTLTNAAGNFNSIINSAIAPDIVKYHSRGENNKLYLSLTANLFIGGIVVNFGVLLSLFFIEQFYKIWTHGQLVFNKSLFLFLAAGISFSNYGIGFVTFFFNVNKLREFTYINVLKTLSLFIAAYYFLGKNDITTVGISVAISEFIASAVVPLYLWKKTMPDLFSEKRYVFFILTIMSPIIISTLAILSYFNYLTTIYIFISLVLLSAIYFLNWEIMDVELKSRFKSIILRRT